MLTDGLETYYYSTEKNTEKVSRSQFVNTIQDPYEEREWVLEFHKTSAKSRQVFHKRGTQTIRRKKVTAFRNYEPSVVQTRKYQLSRKYVWNVSINNVINI